LALLFASDVTRLSHIIDAVAIAAHRALLF
jgi:hypothetical protein